MIGKPSVGSLRPLPGLSSGVLTEVVKLFATLGDSKKLVPLLEQMREIQAHNEQVFRDAQDANVALSVERRALEDSRIAFAAVKAQEDLSTKNRSSALSEAEAKLSGRIARFGQDQVDASAIQAETVKKLDSMEQSLRRRESECKAKEEELTERIAKQDKNEKELSTRFAQLIEKERKLRVVLEG